jgi:hypothetical protein
MKIKKIMLLSVLFCAITKPNYLDDKQIVPISILKCGTHLLLKCINLLTKRDFVVWTPQASIAAKEKFTVLNFYKMSIEALKELTNLPQNLFLKTHLFYSDEYAAHLANEKFIKFFVYRDPRDMVVSLAFFVLKQKKEWPMAQAMSFDDRLLDIITEGKMFYQTHPPVSNGIAELYGSYFNWLKMPNMLSIRFEDLVGPKGGGTVEAQRKTIRKIVEHLGLNLSEAEIEAVSNKIFGGTFSFREGKIGSWKKYFKPIHIEAFKAHAGQTLIDWGYEKDLNW